MLARVSRTGPLLCDLGEANDLSLCFFIYKARLAATTLSVNRYPMNEIFPVTFPIAAVTLLGEYNVQVG